MSNINTGTTNIPIPDNAYTRWRKSTELCYMTAWQQVQPEAAKELFDFICKNVELPDVKPNPADGLVEFAKKYIEKLAKDKGVDL
ncbi:MAG: hypothetical protein J6U49_06620 [Alistipes sp.]|nr:hypothetical protein [Alistipes sp.]